MQKARFYIALLLVSLFIASCDSGSKGPGTAPATDLNQQSSQDMSEGEEHKVVADEVINTSNYTYVKVSENGEQFWIAVNRQEVKVGGAYYFRGGFVMEDFHSAELNRNFDSVYLVSNLYDEAGQSASPLAEQSKSAPETPTTSEPQINVAPAAGAITIADLMASPGKYEGKKVKVTGKCVKFNAGIMGKNWVHIQDGSKGNIDMTITTNETVQVGSVVTLEGIIILNKDFGAGYKYDVIMEEAVIK